MAQQNAPKCRNMSGGGSAGAMWFAGWLFTMAFTQPVWWKWLLGLLLWPYYLGAALR